MRSAHMHRIGTASRRSVQYAIDSSVNGLAAPTGQRLPDDGTIGCFAADLGVESGRGEARTGICVGVGEAIEEADATRNHALCFGVVASTPMEVAGQDELPMQVDSSRARHGAPEPATSLP